MAGDWIKMRGNLWDDPRISKLCDVTECGESQVIGGLYWLWSTADQHTEDGIMPGLTMRQIDRKTGISGFGSALCSIGWLADHPEGVRIIKFEEHNGSSAKRRSTDAQRKASERSGGEKKLIVDRKFISSSTKARIFALDGFKCVYCGRHKDDPVSANLNPKDYQLSIDHLTPFCLGGDDSEENLVTACLPCNMSKNGRTPEEWGVVPDMSIRYRTRLGQSLDKSGHDAELEKRREEKRREDKEKIKKPPPPSGMEILLQSGVDEQTATDWLSHRKAKKVSATKTVLDDRIRQSKIAGITLVDALRMEISRGWAGFEAEWVKPQSRASPKNLDLAATQKAENEKAKRLLFGSDDGMTIDAE